MNRIKYEGKELPLSRLASLKEAVNWIAYRRPPVERRYKAFVRKAEDDSINLDSARLELFYCLIEKKLTACGVKCQIALENPVCEAGYPIYPEPYYRVIDADYGEPVTIDVGEWVYDNIVWSENALIDFTSSLYGQEFSTGFCYISVETQYLFELFPPTNSDDKSPAPRANQIHKQVCQAVASTLWKINPEMTSQEIQKHPALLE